MLGPLAASPRMRGTPPQLLQNPNPIRFIPAHAGNTYRGDCASRSKSVHPRACGEHCRICRSLPTRRGSSPRMRGTLVSGGVLSDDSRFIPAHAGNTEQVFLYYQAQTVHPRACGEHAILSATVVPSAGSSPRMRGTRIEPEELKALIRFIPAHAGNTKGLRFPGP